MSLLRRVAIFNMLFCLSFFVGCGYSLNHRLKDTFQSSKQTVFVPVFTNNTEEVGSEIVFTNALIRELESHGEKLVASRNAAGLEIRGTVLGNEQKVEAFTGTGTQGERSAAPLQPFARIPDQIGVRVGVAIQIWDVEKNAVRWQKDFSAYRRVSAPLDRVSALDAPSSLGLITQSIIEASYPDIARDIMRQLYDQMVDVY